MEDSMMVSIDCITYNHDKYLAKAIDSFLMQKTDFPFEILIHDDASSDGTQDIIRRYQEKYPDMIKPYIQEVNQYSQGVRRMGYTYNVKRAKGKYIAICEGDDYWTDPDKLQKQVDYMEAHDKCGFCFHGARVVDEDEKEVDIIRPYLHSRKAKVEDVIERGGAFISTNSILYRKSLMDNPPEFYMNGPVGDYSLQIYLSTREYGYYINELMSSYRYNAPGSWTNNLYFKAGSQSKREAYDKKKIEMLEGINVFYEYKYDAIIKKIITDIEFNHLIGQGKFSALGKGKYKEVYHNLPLMRKIRLPIQVKLPKLYYGLWYMKHFVGQKLRHIK